MKHKMLIVDDDEAIRTQMKWALSQDYEVHFAEDRKGALEAFEANSPAVTLLDLGLPPRPNDPDEGLAALSEILAVDSTAKVIVVSGQREKRNAIEAVGAGAYDFLCASRSRWRNSDCSFGDVSRVLELEKEYRRVTTKPAVGNIRGDVGHQPANAGSLCFYSQGCRDGCPGAACSARAALARKWPQRRFTARSRARMALLSRSTATQFPKTFWKANSSVTKKARSPVRTFSARACWKQPAAVRCFLDEIGELPPRRFR